MKTKIEKIVEQIKLIKDENNYLKMRVSALENEIIKYQNNENELRIELKLCNLAQNFGGLGEREKESLNDLIQEIDSCLEILGIETETDARD